MEKYTLSKAGDRMSEEKPTNPRLQFTAHGLQFSNSPVYSSPIHRSLLFHIFKIL